MQFRHMWHVRQSLNFAVKNHRLQFLKKENPDVIRNKPFQITSGGNYFKDKCE